MPPTTAPYPLSEATRLMLDLTLVALLLGPQHFLLVSERVVADVLVGVLAPHPPCPMCT